MKLLIKKATIIAPHSPLNGKIRDILIVDGIISKIAATITEKVNKTIEQKGLHVSIGWVDIFAHFNDPGFEYKETIETGLAAAAAGGFTDVFVIPNNSPVTHNKSQVEYIRQKSSDFAVTIHPIGAVTKNAEGKELAEMYDMYQSGAVAFSDGINSIQSSGIVLKALQYVKAFNGTVIQIPDDKTIGTNGLINEGIVSTQLGLPGKPAMAEELMVARDIKLARYTESKLHFTGVTSAKSIEYIKRAKEGGLQVSCSVSPYHLFFIDEDVRGYDTNLKLNPPLRTNKDRQALIKAITNGVVDCIASHHIPQDWDNKICEFEYAKSGMIGLETLFGCLISILGEKEIDLLITMLTVNNRNIFNLPIPQIAVGEKACLTLFNPTIEYTFEETMIKSKSKNSAFIGKLLKGKVVGIVNANKIEIN
ncbi:MAG: dihydroorotase [Ferruginibacter sp.]|nr:dihydroorotase [Ferruginibacter sp.]